MSRRSLQHRRLQFHEKRLAAVRNRYAVRGVGNTSNGHRDPTITPGRTTSRAGTSFARTLNEREVTGNRSFECTLSSRINRAYTDRAYKKAQRIRALSASQGSSSNIRRSSLRRRRKPQLSSFDVNDAIQICLTNEGKLILDRGDDRRANGCIVNVRVEIVLSGELELGVS